MEQFHRSAAVAAESNSSYARLDSTTDGDSVALKRGYEVRGQPAPNCFLQCVSCTACARGGCCRLAPAQVVVTQDGVVQRINLIVRVQGCCSNAGTGLVDSVPPELSPIFSQPDVQRFLYELSDIGQLRSTGCGAFGRCLLCVWLPCMWTWLCNQHTTEVLRWNEALLDWQRRFNAEVLHSKGMAVKTQSYCDVFYDQNGKHRSRERWIAVAMNPAEATRLASEPHLMGDIERGGCGGVDEAGLVLHP
jgi:hypothetical protein